jgi:hypothetical protein
MSRSPHWAFGEALAARMPHDPRLARRIATRADNRSVAEVDDP